MVIANSGQSSHSHSGSTGVSSDPSVKRKPPSNVSVPSTPALSSANPASQRHSPGMPSHSRWHVTIIMTVGKAQGVPPSTQASQPT